MNVVSIFLISSVDALIITAQPILNMGAMRIRLIGGFTYVIPIFQNINLWLGRVFNDISSLLKIIIYNNFALPIIAPTMTTTIVIGGVAGSTIFFREPLLIRGIARIDVPCFGFYLVIG
jgi:hypothetical protein